jgi:alkylation response protein AidB-like acyl-CoA dehydrogenase
VGRGSGKRWAESRKSCDRAGARPAATRARHISSLQPAVTQRRRDAVLDALTMLTCGRPGRVPQIIFDQVRVPASYLLTEEGRGFEIAQGRLGPGRLHHCMRTIGQAETGLGAMVHRIKSRKAFGSLLAEKAQIVERMAEFRTELTAARQLCYLAAAVADEKGWKAAKAYVSMIKVLAPRVSLKILDEAIQVHGAHGLSQARDPSLAFHRPIPGMPQACQRPTTGMTQACHRHAKGRPQA